MKSKYSIHEKTIKYSWMLSYFTVLFAAMIICLIIFVRIEGVIETEINRSNDIFLKQIQKYIDGLVVDSKLLGINISLSPQIQEVMNYKKPLDSAQYQKVNECVKELSSYKLANTSIHDIYIYFKNIDLVVNENSYSDSLSFYRSFLQYNNMAYSDWSDKVTKYYNGNYVSNISGKAYKKNNVEDISYVRSLPLLRPDVNSASVVVSINDSKFLSMVDEVKSVYRGKVLILDNENNVVWATLNFDKLPDKLNYETMYSDKGLILGKEANKEVVISYISSKAENWKYVLIIPKEVFWQKLTNARYSIFFGILFGLFVCSILTYIIVKRNYEPMYNLLNSVSRQSELGKEKVINEYNYIESAMNKIVDEKNKIKLELIGQKAVIKSRMLEKLLKGRLRDINEKSFEAVDIHFISDTFAVILFYIEDLNFKLDDDNYINEEDYKIIYYDISSSLKSSVQEADILYITDIDDMIACIVNLNANSEKKACEVMNTITQKVYSDIFEKHAIYLSISVSNIHSTKQGIADAYNEAAEAMEYKEVMGIKDVMYYSMIVDKQNVEYYYPVEKEQQIISYIKLGNFENVNTILESLLNENFKRRNISTHMAKCMMFNLLGTSLKAINEIDGIAGEKFSIQVSNLEQLAGQLMHNHSINGIVKELTSIIREVCSSIQESRRNNKGNNHMKSEIERYVLDNYMDENLCIASVAEHFKMHPTYISKLYKMQANESILDFLNKVRIEKAKQIMQNRKINIEDAAKEVGYSSLRTFIRIFNKLEGTSPGKYKDSIS